MRTRLVVVTGRDLATSVSRAHIAVLFPAAFEGSLELAKKKKKGRKLSTYSEIYFIQILCGNIMNTKKIHCKMISNTRVEGTCKVPNT